MNLTPREYETLMIIMRSVGYYQGREAVHADLRRQMMMGPNAGDKGGDINIDAVSFQPAKGKSA